MATHIEDYYQMNINGIEFLNKKNQQFGTVIWESNSHFLKIQDWVCEDKRHLLYEEANIIQKLNELGCVCMPRLVDIGTYKNKPYYITKKVHQKRGMTNADALFAFLELKGCGVIHGDLNYIHRYFFPKQGNVLFNGLHCVLIDFDQAIIDPEVSKLNLDDLFEYMDVTYPEWGANCGGLKEQLERFKYRRYINGVRLDLAGTTLVKKGVSTDYGQGVYHTIDEKNVFIKGERDLKDRLAVLKKINFTNEEVLDIGCNTGLVTRYVVRNNAKWVDGIEYCREHALAGQIINHCESIFNSSIKWHDLSNTPINKYYDTILLFSVLHHINDMKFAVEQIKGNCGRILIECRLKEDGYQHIDNNWIKTNMWDYKDFDTLINTFENLFEFSFNQDYGQVDRDRRILEFIKE